jgi:glycosyltransferase involved in cell wall biosynthesis
VRGAVAKAFERLADEPERRREMGANGRSVVLEKYNWEVESRRVLDAYAWLLPG